MVCRRRTPPPPVFFVTPPPPPPTKNHRRAAAAGENWPKRRRRLHLRRRRGLLWTPTEPVWILLTAWLVCGHLSCFRTGVICSHCHTSVIRQPQHLEQPVAVRTSCRWWWCHTKVDCSPDEFEINAWTRVLLALVDNDLRIGCSCRSWKMQNVQPRWDVGLVKDDAKIVCCAVLGSNTLEKL